MRDERATMLQQIMTKIPLPSQQQVTGFFKEFFELMGEHMTELGDKEAEAKAKAETEANTAGERQIILILILNFEF